MKSDPSFLEDFVLEEIDIGRIVFELHLLEIQPDLVQERRDEFSEGDRVVLHRRLVPDELLPGDLADRVESRGDEARIRFVRYLSPQGQSPRGTMDPISCP